MKCSLAFLGAAALMTAASTASAAVVYGNGTETANRFNPGPGVIMYQNCFVDTSGGGTQLQLDSVTVGIRRLVSGASLVDVGLNIYVTQMVFDGVNFSLGTQQMIYSTNSLGVGNATLTQMVTVNTNMLVNLEMLSNGPAFGGLYIGVEFTGANAANAANGWRVVNAPSVGASYNSFGMYNYGGSGTFVDGYAFNPTGSASRMMVNLEGSVVPAPGALALLGVAGLIGGRRRR
jgi:MYXO-CTERM domain-containing protein